MFALKSDDNAHAAPRTAEIAPTPGPAEFQCEVQPDIILGHIEEKKNKPIKLHDEYNSRIPSAFCSFQDGDGKLEIHFRFFNRSGPCSEPKLTSESFFNFAMRQSPEVNPHQASFKHLEPDPMLQECAAEGNLLLKECEAVAFSGSARIQPTNNPNAVNNLRCKWPRNLQNLLLMFIRTADRKAELGVEKLHYGVAHNHSRVTWFTRRLTFRTVSVLLAGGSKIACARSPSGQSRIHRGACIIHRESVSRLSTRGLRVEEIRSFV